MTRLSTFVASAVVVCLVAPPVPASAQTAAKVPQATVASAGVGSIRGLVLDTQGKPLVGAMISALGSSVAFALSGRDGRFLLESLPPGAYTLRVHLDGYSPSQRQMVDVRPSVPAVVSVALRALGVSGSSGSGPTVLAASVLPLDGAAGTGAGAGAADAEHSHSDTAWRLRHLTRSVLKNTDSPLIITDEAVTHVPDSAGTFFGRAFESSARMAASIFGDVSLNGQVNFVTTGAFSGSSDVLSPTAFAAASVAYVSLGAPTGLGDWAVRGAMTQGNLGSWFVEGSLTARASSSHRYIAGLSYSTQRLSRIDPFAVVAINSGSRAMGRVYGFDEWILSRRVSVGYGLSYAWQDYAGGDGLLSPRVSLTVSPISRTRLRTVVARTAMAPGTDEFTPASTRLGAMWLPPQRSFSSWSSQAGLSSQTTDHFEVGVERDIAAYVIGFRTFFQRVEDQGGSMFAPPSLEHPAATLGHYFVGNVGDVEARGWAVTVSRSLLGSIRGSVDYSQTSAHWQNGVAAAMTGLFGSGGRDDTERIHDLTTSVETAIPQTATRVYVLYKLNSAFARSVADARGPGFDARFDIQVNQALPFLDFTSADWEVLVAVCNLFRDMTGERSIYDELLVVRPPKRVVGGVRVRF